MKTYADFSQAWFSELSETVAVGEESHPRGFRTFERRWVEFAVEDPLSFPVTAPGRKFANVIGILEGLSLVGQVSVPETFTDRVSKFREFTDAGIFHGAYGQRVNGRLGDLVELLKRDPDTRQAVLTIYDSRSDLGAVKRDIPCTVAFQFLRSGRTLEMRATMRSNDMWLGTPYDFAQFAILQASVAQAVGLLPGRYVHSVGSLHVYDRDLPAIEKVEGPAPNDMGFPLWHCEDDIGEISSRARRLLLDPKGFDHRTEFEVWAVRHLWREGLLG